MSLLSVSNLTFRYDGSYDTIFEKVSFQLDTNWKLGFIGRNGRGKTTFLQLLMGKYAYHGTISASVCFDYFPFAVKDPTRDTLDVIAQIVPNYELWSVQKELSTLEVSEDVLYRPFCTLSNGEQTKVLLAALFQKENHFLLIDEPTNHLDRHGRQVVGEYLRRKRGFLLVSHDRAFLDQCVDHVLSINRRNIEVQKGNFSSWQHNKAQEDAFERAKNEKLKREIQHLSDAARRTADWSDAVEKTKKGSRNSGLRPDRGYIGHKAAKMMNRAKTVEGRRQKAVEEKSELLKNIESADPLAIQPLHYPSRRLLEVENLSVSYENRPVFSNLSFSVSRGECIALVGKNGCGKSSLLKLLAGEAAPHQGTVRRGSHLIVSYVSQDTSFLQGNLAEFAYDSHIDETQLKTILRKLDFSRAQFDKDMRELSAGQKKKVLLARSLCQPAHLYLWDEPLNFIDVLSRMQIEALLLQYTPTLLFVEHDRTFVQAIATRQLCYGETGVIEKERPAEFDRENRGVVRREESKGKRSAE